MRNKNDSFLDIIKSLKANTVITFKIVSGFYFSQFYLISKQFASTRWYILFWF